MQFQGISPTQLHDAIWPAEDPREAEHQPHSLFQATVTWKSGWLGVSLLVSSINQSFLIVLDFLLHTHTKMYHADIFP